MKKLYVIANRVYLPLSEGNKYISGSISGTLFFDEILTLDEIKAKHKDYSYPLEECDNLHDLCKTWGVR